MTKWTEREDQALIAGRANGYTTEEIAKELRRTRTSVAQRIVKFKAQGRFARPETTVTTVAGTNTYPTTAPFSGYNETYRTSRPMFAIVGSRQEITETLRQLMN